jgi:catechol 2,3-dioxygenase-like lactoylglutathione lyase family enzyme
MVLRLMATKFIGGTCSICTRKSILHPKPFGGLPLPGKAATVFLQARSTRAARGAAEANTEGEEAMAAFTHVTVGTNDLAKARAFYDSVLAPLGLKRLKDLGDRGSIWGQSAEEFFVLTPADGKPACPANGGTVSFEAPSRAAVSAFHKAALAAGGKDEGAVGPRGFWPNAYAGYVRDLDGNKLAAYCRKAE